MLYYAFNPVAEQKHTFYTALESDPLLIQELATQTLDYPEAVNALIFETELYIRHSKGIDLYSLLSGEKLEEVATLKNDLTQFQGKLFYLSSGYIAFIKHNPITSENFLVCVLRENSSEIKQISLPQGILNIVGVYDSCNAVLYSSTSKELLFVDTLKNTIMARTSLNYNSIKTVNEGPFICIYNNKLYVVSCSKSNVEELLIFDFKSSGELTLIKTLMLGLSLYQIPEKDARIAKTPGQGFDGVYFCTEGNYLVRLNNDFEFDTVGKTSQVTQLLSFENGYADFRKEAVDISVPADFTSTKGIPDTSLGILCTALDGFQVHQLKLTALTPGCFLFYEGYSETTVKLTLEANKTSEVQLFYYFSETPARTLDISVKSLNCPERILQINFKEKPITKEFRLPLSGTGTIKVTKVDPPVKEKILTIASEQE